MLLIFVLMVQDLQVGRSLGEAVVMLHTECECGFQGIGYSTTKKQMREINATRPKIWRAMWEDGIGMFLKNEPMEKQEEKDAKDDLPES